MKKSIFSIIMAITMLLSLFCFATSAASKIEKYYLPLATTAPNIDGEFNDPAWSGKTLTVNFSSIKDIIDNGGYVKNRTAETGATGVMKAVWSNESGKEGLYFYWHVKDPTQSFATDKLGFQFNAMDAVQVVIDPLGRQYATRKNCAMCFTFVAYTGESGNGMAPTAGANWYEHWMWEGNNSAITGVQVNSATNKVKDEIKENGIDRVYLLDEYEIEAYIPGKAMNIDNQEPEFKIGTKMGIGFTLIDYDWISENFTFEKVVDSQKLINLYADFGNGKDKFESPRFYHEMYLANENGEVIDNPPPPPEDPTIEGGGETTTAPYASSVEAFAALKTELETAKEITENEKIAAYYNETGVENLKTAVDAAAGLTETNTVDELAAAVTSVKDARLALESTKTLKELIDAIKEFDESDFGSADWQAIQDKLTAAEGFLNDDGTENNEDPEPLAATKLGLIKILTENEKTSTPTTDNNQTDNDKNTETKEEGFPVWAIILIIAAVVLIVAIIIIVVVVNNKKKKQQLDEETPEEDKIDEYQPKTDAEDNSDKE
mgnify:CR=1 FL=1